jgi:flagellar biosynthesis chaperone FliJ
MVDTLATLARLRRVEMETAKRALADATLELRAARDKVAAAEAAIGAEARIAASPAEFAAWLPRARQMIAAARMEAVDAERRHQAARAAFVESNAAEKSVETLLEQRETKARALQARRAEHALSDLYRQPGAK